MRQLFNTDLLFKLEHTVLRMPGIGDEDRNGFVLVDWEEVDMLQGLCACIRSQDHRRQIGHLSQNITTPLDDFFNVQLTIKEDFL